MWLLIVIVSALPILPFAGKITPELQAQISEVGDNEKVYVIVHMQESYPYDELEDMPIEEKARAYKYIARTSQQPLIDFLIDIPDGASDIQQFWVFNGFHMKATRDVIGQIAQRDDVRFITHNATIQLYPVHESPIDVPEWNISKIQADSCWYAGYTGAGVFIGNIDTGCDFTHPAFAGNFSGWWLDVVNGLSAPYDDHNHGTHTAGTVCGGDGLGAFVDDIGVAPDAQMVTAKCIDNTGVATYAWLDAGMQWMADLKADSGVGIKAVANGWGAGRYDLHFWGICATWKSLDILPVFAIGSSGPGYETTRAPGNYPTCMGLGSTDQNDQIASFSGWGPSPDQPPWNEPGNWYRPDWNLISPDIVAPGVNIRSSVVGGGYAIWSGTSMSAMHAAGAVALFSEYDPHLSATTMYMYLTYYADTLGSPCPNNIYGWGRLNVWRILQAITGTEETITRSPTKDYLFPTVFAGPLILPQDKTCKVFDITGRVVQPKHLEPGVYFIEIDGRIVNKVIKVR